MEASLVTLATCFSPSTYQRVDGPHDLTTARVVASLSPSLRRLDTRRAAFETKFLVDEKLAVAIEAAIQTYMTPDPHHDAEGSYALSTIYFDSPEMDVLRRRGRFRFVKFRARRYGANDEIFLERKLKKGRVVRKRRCPAPLDATLFAGESPAAIPPGVEAYRRLLGRLRMTPVCVLRYRRTAFFGTCGDGPLRLTFDRKIVGRRVSDWSFEGEGDAIDVMDDGEVVCEFKYQDRLPAPFKALLHEFQLLPQGVSKYRRCMERFGVDSREGGEDA